MARWKVLVPTTLYGPEVEAYYAATGDVELVYALPPPWRVYGGGPLGPAEQRRRATEIVWARIAEADAVGAMPGPPFVTAALLDAAPRLRVVYVASVGTDSIDVEAATERGVAVVNAAGNNAVAVAEHALGLMLALIRKIVQADRMIRRDRRSVHLSELGEFPGLLRGRTLGLVGFGQIGREVARIATQGFGMTVVAYDPYAEPAPGVDWVDSLPELLARADIVSVHIPLTAQTRHTMGAAELAAMKPGAFLINTSRGGTIDTDALVDALRAEQIAGAGLDVTDPEPLPDGHPLHELEAALITPHAAGAAPEVVIHANLMAAESVVRALRRERPATLVNPEVWATYLDRWKDD